VIWREKINPLGKTVIPWNIDCPEMTSGNDLKKGI